MQTIETDGVLQAVLAVFKPQVNSKGCFSILRNAPGVNVRSQAWVRTTRPMPTFDYFVE